MAHAFHVFLLGYMLANSSRFPHVFLQKNPQKTLQQFSIDLENHHIIMRKSPKKKQFNRWENLWENHWWPMMIHYFPMIFPSVFPMFSDDFPQLMESPGGALGMHRDGCLFGPTAFLWAVGLRDWHLGSKSFGKLHVKHVKHGDLTWFKWKTLKTCDLPRKFGQT